MTMNNQERIRTEFVQMMGRCDVLRPEDVVAYAQKHKRSATREAFDKQGLFDDKSAAEKMRLVFARTLIQRVKIRYSTPETPPTPVRLLVNLTDERKTEARGYRVRGAVLSHSERCEMLRRDFSRDIESVIRRYIDILTREQQEALREVACEVSETALVKEL